MVCAAGATADRDARRAPARALAHDIDKEQEHKQKYYFTTENKSILTDFRIDDETREG